MRDLIKGKKTYIVAALMAVSVFLDYLTGDISMAQMVASGDVQTLLEAAGLSTLRAGIAK